MKHTKIIKLLPLAIAASIANSNAAIAAVSDDLSSDTSSLWTSVGTATPTSITQQANNRDIGAVDDGTGALSYQDVAGDGQSDGSLNFNLSNATQGDEAIQYNLAGVLELGEMLSLTAYAGTATSSFTNFTVQLYNITDDTVLAESGNTLRRPIAVGAVIGTATTDPTVGVGEFNVSYTALAGDVGDTVGIRIVENANNQSRDILLDSFTLTSVTVPEPSSISLLGLGGLALLRRRRK